MDHDGLGSGTCRRDLAMVLAIHQRVGRAHGCPGSLHITAPECAR